MMSSESYTQLTRYDKTYSRPENDPPMSSVVDAVAVRQWSFKVNQNFASFAVA